MIVITRLNHHPFVVNSDLVKFIEQAPDTVITLVSGEKIIVLETPEQVMERIVAFRRRLLQGLDLGTGSDERMDGSPRVRAAGNPGGNELTRPCHG